MVQSFSDDPLTHDPNTGVPVERVLHAPALHFKGKGFYNTDYGTRKRQRETASAADGSGGSSEGSSSESKDSSAPETKAKPDSSTKDSTKPAEKSKPVASQT